MAADDSAEVPDPRKKAERYRGEQEMRRLEAGERFDKYLLAGAGGGLYLATVVFKYALQAGPWARWSLIVGVLLLLAAAAAIFENARLLYNAYTLRRDQIDALLGVPGTEGGKHDDGKQEAMDTKLARTDWWMKLWNGVSYCCLFAGATLLLASFGVAAASYRSQAMGKSQEKTNARPGVAPGRLNETARPDKARQDEIKASLRQTPRKPAAQAGRPPGDASERPNGDAGPKPG